MESQHNTQRQRKRKFSVSPRLAKLTEDFVKGGGRFETIKIGKLFEIEKGKRLTKANMVPGNVNYIGAISSNNGIRQKISTSKKWEANCITVNYNGSVGCAYYQDEEFYASDDVNILYLKNHKLDSDLALYFCACIFKCSKSYGYSHKWTKDKMLASGIVLPTSNGAVDFAFMRRYIATLKAERVATLKAYLQVSGLADTRLTAQENDTLRRFDSKEITFAEFDICGKEGLFKVNNTHNILKSEIVPGSGTSPYVGAGESDNSVQCYVSYKPELIEKGNSIMIGGKTLVVTYQEEDYYSNDSHNLALYYQKYDNLTRNIQLFLVSSLYKSLKPKYSWGDSISGAKIKKDTIFLPVDDNGEIDHEFMETYISAQTKLCIRTLMEAKDLEIETTETLINNPSPQIKEEVEERLKFVEFLPYYSLRAACGYFGNAENVEALGWVKAEGVGRLNENMFVVKACGDSMLPKIQNGDLCVFQANVTGSRQEKILLVQHNQYDSDYDGAYTIKEYSSTKSYDEDGNWQHESICLLPLNKDYDPIVLDESNIRNIKVIGEFVGILDIAE